MLLQDITRFVNVEESESEREREREREKEMMKVDT